MAGAPKNIWQIFGFASELGFIIAIPLVALGSLGKYVDGRWGTRPWLTLAGVLLAMAASGVWVYQYLKPLLGFKKQNVKIKTTPPQ